MFPTQNAQFGGRLQLIGEEIDDRMNLLKVPDGQLPTWCKQHHIGHLDFLYAEADKRLVTFQPSSDSRLVPGFVVQDKRQYRVTPFPNRESRIVSDDMLTFRRIDQVDGMVWYSYPPAQCLRMGLHGQMRWITPGINGAQGSLVCGKQAWDLIWFMLQSWIGNAVVQQPER